MNEKDPGPNTYYENLYQEERKKLIAEFIHNWIGLRHLCQDAADNGNEESWKYWLKIYK